MAAHLGTLRPSSPRILLFFAEPFDAANAERLAVLLQARGWRAGCCSFTEITAEADPAGATLVVVVCSTRGPRFHRFAAWGGSSEMINMLVACFREDREGDAGIQRMDESRAAALYVSKGAEAELATEIERRLEAILSAPQDFRIRLVLGIERLRHRERLLAMLQAAVEGVPAQSRFPMFDVLEAGDELSEPTLRDIGIGVLPPVAKEQLFAFNYPEPLPLLARHERADVWRYLRCATLTPDLGLGFASCLLFLDSQAPAATLEADPAALVRTFWNQSLVKPAAVICPSVEPPGVDPSLSDADGFRRLFTAVVRDRIAMLNPLTPFSTDRAKLRCHPLVKECLRERVSLLPLEIAEAAARGPDSLMGGGPFGGLRNLLQPGDEVWRWEAEEGSTVSPWFSDSGLALVRCGAPVHSVSFGGA